MKNKFVKLCCSLYAILFLGAIMIFALELKNTYYAYYPLWCRITDWVLLIVNSLITIYVAKKSNGSTRNLTIIGIVLFLAFLFFGTICSIKEYNNGFSMEYVAYPFIISACAMILPLIMIISTIFLNITQEEKIRLSNNWNKSKHYLKFVLITIVILGSVYGIVCLVQYIKLTSETNRQNKIQMELNEQMRAEREQRQAEQEVAARTAVAKEIFAGTYCSDLIPIKSSFSGQGFLQIQFNKDDTYIMRVTDAYSHGIVSNQKGTYKFVYEVGALLYDINGEQCATALIESNGTIKVGDYTLHRQ